MSNQANDPGAASPTRPRLLEQVRNAIRRKHYSLRTEDSYVHWIKRFIYFHGKRHPRDLGEPEVTAFLNYLARERNVASSTQNQALSAVLFLYKEVLVTPLAWLDGLDRAKRPVRVPSVLTAEEVRRLLARLEGTKWLIRDAKGAKDRVTMLPEAVIEPLKAHLVRAKVLHEADLAAREAGIARHVSCHALRHSFATHVMNKGGRGVRSPLDRAEQPRAVYAA